MLYYLTQWLLDAVQGTAWAEHLSPLRVFRYITFRTAGAAITALLLSLWLGPLVIRWLKRIKFGQEYEDRAAEAGIPFTLATGSMTAMETVAEQAGGTLWFQLYLWPDRSLSHKIVERAKAAGFEALVVTVDGAVSGNREYNLRNGFTIPFKFTRRNVTDVMRHPRWLLEVLARYVLTSGMPRYEVPDQEFEIDPDLLKEIAASTGGKYYESYSAEKFEEDIADLARTAFQAEIEAPEIDVFEWPLMIALALVALEWLLRMSLFRSVA